MPNTNVIPGTGVIQATGEQPVMSAEFPPRGFPVLFADNIGSIATDGVLVKMYLVRIDPEFASGGQSRSVEFAQVVMPMAGFVATYVFFEEAVNRYLKSGTVKKETVEMMRETFRKS